MAKALKSTHGVLTTMLTPAIVHTAFIYIWDEKGKHIIINTGSIFSNTSVIKFSLLYALDSPPQWASPYMV